MNGNWWSERCASENNGEKQRESWKVEAVPTPLRVTHEGKGKLLISYESPRRNVNCAYIRGDVGNEEKKERDKV